MGARVNEQNVSCSTTTVSDLGSGYMLQANALIKPLVFDPGARLLSEAELFVG